MTPTPPPSSSPAVPQEGGTPRCDKCGIEITTGLQAMLCPNADDCELWPHDGDIETERMAWRMWKGYAQQAFEQMRAERDASEAARIGVEKAALERAAKECEKRAERRWEEYGINEWDTNASYYPDSHLWCEVADEEAESCAIAIRALSQSQAPTAESRPRHVCALSGFNGMIDDCPGCDADRAPTGGEG